MTGAQFQCWLGGSVARDRTWVQSPWPAGFCMSHVSVRPRRPTNESTHAEGWPIIPLTNVLLFLLPLPLPQPLKLFLHPAASTSGSTPFHPALRIHHLLQFLFSSIFLPTCLPSPSCPPSPQSHTRCRKEVGGGDFKGLFDLADE